SQPWIADESIGKQGGSDQTDRRVSSPLASASVGLRQPSTDVPASDFEFNDPLLGTSLFGFLSDWLKPSSPVQDNSYTLVVNDSPQKSPSRSPAEKPKPSSAQTAPLASQKQVASAEKWYWVTLAALAVCAVAIV